MSSTKGRFLHLLVLLSMTSQSSLSAHADPALELKSQSASVDVSQPKTPEPAASQQQQEHKTTTLNGAVQKDDSAAKSPLYLLALKKLSAKEHLTTEEFRSLGIGILGAEITRTYFQTESKVEDLYPGCPAILAGMRLGDKVIDQNAAAEDSNVKDPTRPMWMFSAGIEGQKVDFTVKRHGKELHFQLVRMNMEDVPDPKIRHNYEIMVERLGSSEGSVEVPEPGSSEGRVEMPKPVSAKKILLHSLFPFSR